MSRPTDRHVLDLDRDPVPGDPYEVGDLARKLGDFAGDVATALRSVRGLNGDTVIQERAGRGGRQYPRHGRRHVPRPLSASGRAPAPGSPRPHGA